MGPEFFIGVDLGQVNDPTAICVVSRTEQPTGRLERVVNLGRWFGSGSGPAEWAAPQVAPRYEIIHLERVPLDTSYVDIPPRIATIEQQLRQRWADTVFEITGQGVSPQRAPVELVLDQTGCGRPVVDLFREAGHDPLAITITAGNAVTWAGERDARVSKRILVSQTQALMQSKRLKAASGLGEWPTLRAELGNFRARISLSGSVTFEAGTDEEWRENANDDLLLALALSLWAGENSQMHTGEISDELLLAFADMPRV